MVYINYMVLLAVERTTFNSMWLIVERLNGADDNVASVCTSLSMIIVSYIWMVGASINRFLRRQNQTVSFLKS